LSKVNVVVDNETEPTLLVASVTVVEGLGSALSLTSIVEVPPSATVVPLGVRIIAITVESTVETLVVAPPKVNTTCCDCNSLGRSICIRNTCH
jgi:hypothetical protein